MTDDENEDRTYVDPKTAHQSWVELTATDPERADQIAATVATWLAASHEAKSREADFWSSRPELETVRTFALSRLASPWAVLGGVLARTVAATPWNVYLPPIVGGRGSLNLYMAFVGPSGGGKGIANSVAREVVQITSPADESQVGTGEGLVHAFMRTAKDPDSKEVVPLQYRTNVLLDVPEVDSIRAQAGRTGATLLPFLRSAWSGEAVGRSTADVSRNLTVPAHSYRLAMTVGVQPGRADALLQDTDGGTPQRFVWVPVVDRDIVDGIDEPEPFVWVPPRWRGPVADPDALAASLVAPREMEICDLAQKEIRADRLARARGEGTALDGHAMLARLKVAAALAILNSSTGVRDDDWDLAAVVMEVSNRTRDGIEGHLENEAKQSAQKRGAFEAAVEKTREAIIDKAQVKTVTASIERTLSKLTVSGTTGTDGWVSASDLRKRLKNTLRGSFDDALDSLENVGKVEVKEADSRDGRLVRLPPKGEE
jgi:hypothetical protein